MLRRLVALVVVGAIVAGVAWVGVTVAQAQAISPVRLQVVPVGTVGETPAWWFGLSLNYTIDGKASSP